jgi:hypothetical protein
MASHRRRHEDDAGTASELKPRKQQVRRWFWAEPGLLRAATVNLCPKGHNEAVFLPIVAERLLDSGRIDYTVRWGWKRRVV